MLSILSRNFKKQSTNIYTLITRDSSSASITMDLKLVTKRLQEYANLNLAADWDNVGLLVEPSDKLLVKKILITNDLTEPVLEESIKKNVNMIISYHPAIFQPLKRLTQSEWKQRSIVKCIEKKIAVYSPHTAWDTIDGGINDWILQAFVTKKVDPIQPIKCLVHPCGFSKTIKINLAYGPSKEKLLSKVSGLNDSIRLMGEKDINGPDAIKQVELEFLSSPNGILKLIDLIKSSTDDADILNTLRIYDMEKPFLKNSGIGRLGYLNEPIRIKEVVDKLKTHFGMKTLRLALGNGKTLEDKVKVIAVGAGSGSKVVNNTNADLIVTGEFGHHEILHEVHRGVSVILTDHSNNERGFREEFRKNFTQLLAKYNENVEMIFSEIDRDPLEYI